MIPSKIMERVIVNSLMEHFHKHNIISKAQLGFLKRLSTLPNLLQSFIFFGRFSGLYVHIYELAPNRRQSNFGRTASAGKVTAARLKGLTWCQSVLSSAFVILSCSFKVSIIISIVNIWCR